MRHFLHVISLGVLLAAVIPLNSLAQNPAVVEGFIDVDGGPVWYEINGSGSGIPLLTVHGGPGGQSCGMTLLNPLSTERRIIRYDQLGGGRSGRPRDMSLWELDRFIEELHEVRLGLELEQIHLLGSSWGGALAAAYVLEKGTEGIVSLTLSSPLLSTPAWIEDANYLRSLLPEEMQEAMTRHEAEGTTDSEEYQAATEEFYRRHVRGNPVVRAEGCEGAAFNAVIYEHMWGPTEFRATGNLIDFDLSGRLNEIDIPVLLMAGENDEARPERMEMFVPLFQDARFVMIENAAHSALGNNPDDYLAALGAFLSDTESALSQD